MFKCSRLAHLVSGSQGVHVVFRPKVRGPCPRPNGLARTKKRAGLSPVRVGQVITTLHRLPAQREKEKEREREEEDIKHNYICTSTRGKGAKGATEHSMPDSNFIWETAHGVQSEVAR